MNKPSFRSTVGIFRLVAILEGISYLLLLCLAMPLKYVFNYKSAVLYMGWAHGVLFIAFVILLMLVWIKFKWSFGKVVFAFIMSLIPFGTFVLERKLKKEGH